MFRPSPRNRLFRTFEAILRGSADKGRGSSLSPLLMVASLIACEQTKRPDPIETRANPEIVERTSRAAPVGPLTCGELRPSAAEGRPSQPEKIWLSPPSAEKRIVISKVGVIVSFARDDFLRAARCGGFDQAVRYIEQETGFEPDSEIMDAFQTSYVAAALLDAGRASVRLRTEPGSRAWMIRDPWSERGCNGSCLSLGRIYRLSESEPSFFLRITDSTRNQ